ncbi:uncharacterized protein K452DRAFT_308035 [Aplosporella prunicola CBS 121167]|uniref:Uncharacterized protein n=1 Tax=Aplosporella prunicola CBS 121167 TaxID=1176127 RepID=A0A6A6BGC2_9PEZI|nr:uncharacterized protein K452DRAFT_308035 [Aplosporella prunicola CBS 121167]KAF2142345.1 hypothetical protein K452DRAFT_308035 [Aplosporella prunicola CBS 121167]
MAESQKKLDEALATQAAAATAPDQQQQAKSQAPEQLEEPKEPNKADNYGRNTSLLSRSRTFSAYLSPLSTATGVYDPSPIVEFPDMGDGPRTKICREESLPRETYQVSPIEEKRKFSKLEDAIMEEWEGVQGEPRKGGGIKKRKVKELTVEAQDEDAETPDAADAK